MEHPVTGIVRGEGDREGDEERGDPDKRDGDDRARCPDLEGEWMTDGEITIHRDHH